MFLFLLLTAIAFLLLFILLVQSWRQTPYGELGALPALLLRLAPPPDSRQEASVETEREWVRRQEHICGGWPVHVPLTETFSIPGPAGLLPVRIYHPEPGRFLPLIIYHHGGGWRLGDLESHDGKCRRLARACHLPVLAVDYRRAPEHPFPAALDDAYATLQWAARHGAQIEADPRHLIVLGDSAGGNLAAAVALRARDTQGPPIDYQVLVYPVTDLTRLDRPSYRAFGKGFFLTRKKMETNINAYIPNAFERSHPYASPLLAESHAGLPPTLIIAAGFDPLRDEGRAYADRLEVAGVPVRYSCYRGMIHGFFGLPLFGTAATRAVEEVGEVLRDFYRD